VNVKLIATHKVEDQKMYTPMPPVMPVQDFGVVVTTYRKTYVRGWRTWWRWRIASVATKMELQLIAPAQTVQEVLREEGEQEVKSGDEYNRFLLQWKEVNAMASNTGNTTDQEAMEEIRELTGASSNDAALSAIRGLHEHVRRDVEQQDSQQQGHGDER
jgi:hypothetical protein